MALSGTVVWEVQTGGNDANGGGFNSAAAGTDRSQQTSPHVTIDGTTITATVHTTTTQLTIAGYTVSSADIGNLAKFTGGTGTAGTYQITAVDVANNRWTVDRSAGTSTQTLTGRMGGCKKSPGEVMPLLVNDNLVWIKSGTYTFSTATAGADGPLVAPNGGRNKVEGYSSSRGDKGTAPVISAGSITSVNLVAAGGSTATPYLENLIFDGNNGSGNTCVNTGARWMVYNCQAKNAPTGFTGSGVIEKCYATACSTVGFVNVICHGCVATANGGIGFSNATAAHCISYGNTGDGFQLSSGATTSHCTAYNNGGDGFDMSGTAGSSCINCLSYGNSGYQYNNGAFSGIIGAKYINCAGNNSGLGTFQAVPPINQSFVTLTADPFVNAGSADFRPNNAAGGGAAVRGTALAAFDQVSHLDIGADQHQDAGGGLLSQRGFTGGLPA